MGLHPEGGTRTAAGRAKKIAKKKIGRPPKPGPKAHRKTDITLPPAYIDACKEAARKSGTPLFEWQRLVVHAYAKEMIARPIEPRATACAACLRPFKAPRFQGDHRRLRVSVNFDTDCVELMDWLAENFYHGVWSQAFEAACRFFLGEDAPECAPRGSV